MTNVKKALFSNLTKLECIFLDKKPIKIIAMISFLCHLAVHVFERKWMRTCADFDVVETKFYILHTFQPFEMCVVLIAFGEFS